MTKATNAIHWPTLVLLALTGGMIGLMISECQNQRLQASASTPRSSTRNALPHPPIDRRESFTPTKALSFPSEKDDSERISAPRVVKSKAASDDSLQLLAEYETVVTKLPFKVVSPVKADTYTWTLPPGWVGKANAGEITITDAKNGKATIALHTFRIIWDEKKTENKDHSLTVTVGVNVPVVPVDPVPNPPVDPVPPTTGLYMMVVRADGPADPAFTTFMGNPSWATLMSKGYLVKDFTLTRARELGANVIVGTRLPCVVGLAKKADGKYQQTKVVPMPTTSEGILTLPESLR